MTNRPFEKDDFVTGHSIYRPEIKITGLVKKVTHFECGSANVFIGTDSGLYLSGEEFIVKHIRTPRKGSKEARDIVAMLASEYRKALARKKDDNESEFKRGARCFDKFSKHLIYRKAESMLK